MLIGVSRSPAFIIPCFSRWPFISVIVIDVLLADKGQFTHTLFLPGLGYTASPSGAGWYINPPRAAVPPAVVTNTFPLAPSPTVAVIEVGEITANEAAAFPPNLTA